MLWVSNLFAVNCYSFGETHRLINREEKKRRKLFYKVVTSIYLDWLFKNFKIKYLKNKIISP